MKCQGIQELIFTTTDFGVSWVILSFVRPAIKGYNLSMYQWCEQVEPNGQFFVSATISSKKYNSFQKWSKVTQNQSPYLFYQGSV